MGTVNHFANKNGRVAIFITTMADGGHLFFFQLYWFEMASNAIKSDFRLSKMASSDHFYEKHLGPMTTKYDLVEAKRMIFINVRTD